VKTIGELPGKPLRDLHLLDILDKMHFALTDEYQKTFLVTTEHLPNDFALTLYAYINTIEVFMNQWQPHPVTIKSNPVSDERFEQILAEVAEILFTELRQLKEIPFDPVKGSVEDETLTDTQKAG